MKVINTLSSHSLDVLFCIVYADILITFERFCMDWRVIVFVRGQCIMHHEPRKDVRGVEQHNLVTLHLFLHCCDRKIVVEAFQNYTKWLLSLIFLTLFCFAYF